MAQSRLERANADKKNVQERMDSFKADFLDEGGTGVQQAWKTLLEANCDEQMLTCYMAGLRSVVAANRGISRKELRGIRDKFGHVVDLLATLPRPDVGPMIDPDGEWTWIRAALIEHLERTEAVVPHARKKKGLRAESLIFQVMDYVLAQTGGWHDTDVDVLCCAALRREEPLALRKRRLDARTKGS